MHLGVQCILEEGWEENEVPGACGPWDPWPPIGAAPASVVGKVCPSPVLSNVFEILPSSSQRTSSLHISALP